VLFRHMGRGISLKNEGERLGGENLIIVNLHLVAAGQVPAHESRRKKKTFGRPVKLKTKY